MGVEPRSLGLPAILEHLRDRLAPPEGVMSIYLDASPGRVIGQGHLLFLRDACNAIRPTVPASEQEAFDAAVEQTERHLSYDVAATHPGLAIFAAGDPDYFTSVPLPRVPREEVVWDKRAHIAPLQAVLDDFERIAVVLFDTERARLFSVYLGEVEDELAIDGYVPGKQATDGWYALAQTRYARDHEDHVRRHVQHTVATMMVLLRARPFDRLFLAGPDEALSFLKREMPRPLRARLAGTVHAELFASRADVLHAALEAAERVEREAEVEAVDELIENRSTRLAALGTEATLDALSGGRVHKLFVADTFQAPGAECEGCGRLIVGSGECAVCHEPTAALVDLRERVVERALDQGALVEIASGEAAEKLLTHGGMGAWLRY